MYAKDIKIYEKGISVKEIINITVTISKTTLEKAKARGLCSHMDLFFKSTNGTNKINVVFIYGLPLIRYGWTVHFIKAEYK